MSGKDIVLHRKYHEQWCRSSWCLGFNFTFWLSFVVIVHVNKAAAPSTLKSIASVRLGGNTRWCRAGEGKGKRYLKGRDGGLSCKDTNNADGSNTRHTTAPLWFSCLIYRTYILSRSYYFLYFSAKLRRFVILLLCVFTTQHTHEILSLYKT